MNGGEAVLVLDSGALDEIARDRSTRRSLRRLAESGCETVIPVVVLAEAIMGKPFDAPVNQLVNDIGTVQPDEDLARRAGGLRHRALAADSDREPSGIDALVAAHAVDFIRATVVTTDPQDLALLLVDKRSVSVRQVFEAFAAV